MKSKGDDRAAIPIQFEYIPFDLPFEKGKLTSKSDESTRERKRMLERIPISFNFKMKKHYLRTWMIFKQENYNST